MGYMVNLVLKDRAALVVGGGEIARRKIGDLLAAGAVVTVVAPQPCDAIRGIADRGEIQAYWRSYRTGDIGDSFVVVAATDDEEVNRLVARDAMSQGVLVNVVDRPPLCTFTVPATVSRGDLTIAVATDGRCPSLASILREELEGTYGVEYARVVELFGDLRDQMVARSWEGRRIRATLAGLYRDGVARLLRDGDREGLRELLRSRLDSEIGLPE